MLCGNSAELGRTAYCFLARPHIQDVMPRLHAYSRELISSGPDDHLTLVSHSTPPGVGMANGASGCIRCSVLRLQKKTKLARFCDCMDASVGAEFRIGLMQVPFDRAFCHGKALGNLAVL